MTYLLQGSCCAFHMAAGGLGTSCRALHMQAAGRLAVLQLYQQV